ncbi:hypothetical protein HELRODRAFT_162620 [Helobdella robusta]|uniref:Nucleolar 27S pre-rRNA processing Urb2/Npa2 C-terminal domain-containing protein n=1 Tax=Helobdella robusta TaxID=6412 RepID=T1ESX6_HELRO|nr:hypothetical protein HELRODRAFT_162620 [Helobdella robusta]ESN99126.1 hypothetical protein HELRODRAFT_162620 [Helobdella robusta]
MSNAKTLNYAQQLCDFLILHPLEKVTFDERNKTSDQAADFSLLYWSLACNNFYSVVEFFSKFHELDRCKVHSINFAQKLIECRESDQFLLNICLSKLACSHAEKTIYKYKFFQILSEFTLPFMDEYEKFRALLASLSLLCVFFQHQPTAKPLMEQCLNILHYKNILEKLFKSLMTHALKSSKTINQLAGFVGEVESLVNKSNVNRHSALETLVWAISLIDKTLMQRYVKKDCLTLLKRLKIRLLNKALPKTHQFYQKIAELDIVKDKTKNHNSAKKNQNNDGDNMVVVDDDEYITYFQILDCFIRQRKINDNKFKGDGDDEDDIGRGDNADKEDDNKEEFVLFGAKELLLFFKCALNNIKSSKNAQVVSSSIVLVKEIVSGFRDGSTVLEQSLQKEDNQHDNTFMGLNPDKYLMTAWEITTAKLKIEIANRRKLNSSFSILPSSKAEKKHVHQQFSKDQNQKNNNAVDLIDLGGLLLCVLPQDLLDVALKEIFESLILISITTLLQNCTEAALNTLMLNTLTTYIAQGQDFLTNQDVSLLFHATSTVDLELYPTKLTTEINVVEHISNFLDLFKAYHSVLNALLSHHTTSVYSMIPNFMYGVKKHKLNFNKVVHYVVAEFVDCLQRVVLYPSIKALLQAIYRWLDMCNEYTTAQLHSTLSPGAREIFKSLYGDYQNYHKLKGKN